MQKSDVKTTAKKSLKERVNRSLFCGCRKARSSNSNFLHAFSGVEKPRRTMDGGGISFKARSSTRMLLRSLSRHSADIFLRILLDMCYIAITGIFPVRTKKSLRKDNQEEPVRDPASISIRGENNLIRLAWLTLQAFCFGFKMFPQLSHIPLEWLTPLPQYLRSLSVSKI